ncbi:MAG TPA: zf-HC2 domain-containing protein [Thermoanaerobaculia bacterium]|jgi:hypothetical protein
MNQDEQQLARLRAAFAAPDLAPDPQSCPPPEKLWSAVRGELDPQAMREVLDHVALCSACAEDWRLAAELNRQQAGESAVTPGRVLQGRFGRWRPLAATAALAAGLLLAVGVWRAEMAPHQAPIYREARHESIRSLLPAGQALPRQDAVLRWSPLPGAASYDVRVTTEDLFQTVASAQGTTTTELRVPAAALAGLPPGAKLLWQVDAVRPDGTRETSPTFTTPLQ